MKKRRAMLEAMGHTVSICSAYDWAEYPILPLEFDSTETMRLMRNLFEQMTDFASEAVLKKAFEKARVELKAAFERVINNFAPDMLFVHNILCLPIHPAATVALAETLLKTGLPCTAIHHDILSEGAYKFRPTCDFSRSILDNYFPPIMPNLSHWTINSRNRKSLAAKNVNACIIHDTMDFDDLFDPESHVRLRSDLRSRFGITPHDVVLFVGARIVPNKQTEVAGHLTAELQRLSKSLIGRNLYNDRMFTEQSRIILVLAGRPEAAFLDYRDKLFKFFGSLKISWVYAGDVVRPVRSEPEGYYALYPDMYAMADFILYPTGWEGFGNQLLEAFAADLPATVFEYPVFQEDIGPKGVRYVSIGDKALPGLEGLMEVPTEILKKAAHEMLSILSDSESYNSVTAQNVAIGKKYFSFDVLRSHLNDSLEWAKSVKRL
jgi:glycosyltransferase involved in cell wall biosynthesis